MALMMNLVSIALLFAGADAGGHAMTCRGKTFDEVIKEYRIEAGCPDATPTGCKCMGHNKQSVYDCPAESYTLWSSTNKTCVRATPDRDDRWYKHDWDYPSDHGAECKPIDGSKGSPTGFNHWIDPGSYACTKVEGQPHMWNKSSAGYNALYSSQGWCTDSAPWCYVDPCECDAVDIGISSWFQKPTPKGKLYYSYLVCSGGSDTFQSQACDSATDEASCCAEPGCTVDGKGCPAKAGAMQCGDIKGSYKAQGCCGAPEKEFIIPRAGKD